MFLCKIKCLKAWILQKLRFKKNLKIYEVRFRKKIKSRMISYLTPLLKNED